MEPPLKVGQILDTDIEALAYGGDGIARPEGFTLFVPRTVPGDRVKVEVTDVRRRYGRSIPQEILTRSPRRIEPKCKYFGECGGCHYQQIDPSYVSEQKVLQIHDALERIAHEDIPVHPLIVPEAPWNYRNRLTYHRSPTGAAGYISWRDHQIIDVDDCPIAQPALNELWKEIRSSTQQISADVLPFIILRQTSSGQNAVILSLTESTALRAVATTLNKVDLLYATFIQRGAVSPFGKTIEAVRGPALLTETVAGIRYSVRPDLFFQVHPEVTEKVARQVISWAEDAKPKRVIDVYCGAGLFSLLLAKQGIDVLGVEVSHASVLCAQESAQISHLDTKASFRGGKAERIVERLIREGERFDAAVVDPPRKGLHPQVIESLSKLGVTKLLYVSCSPPTLARDVKALRDQGFRIDWVTPFDMFPQTYHVETVSSFSR